MFTKRIDEKGFTHYEFKAGGYDFYVFRSAKVGYWTVYRAERGAQLRGNGKTFWKTEAMVAHYKTAQEQLAAIVADDAASQQAA